MKALGEALLVNFYIHVPYRGNLLWGKLWQIQAQSIAIKMLISGIMSNWWVKLRRICSESQNSLKFSPAKVSIYTVLSNSILVSLYVTLHSLAVH